MDKDRLLLTLAACIESELKPALISLFRDKGSLYTDLHSVEYWCDETSRLAEEVRKLLIK